MSSQLGLIDWPASEFRLCRAHRFRGRIASLLSARSLDRALAEGTDPRASAALAYRASKLTRLRTRRLFAHAIRDLIECDEHPPRVPSPRIPPDPLEVPYARENLEQLEELLLSQTLVYAEGMARLQLLLTDAESAVYSAAYPGALGHEIETVIGALEGRDGA